MWFTEAGLLKVERNIAAGSIISRTVAKDLKREPEPPQSRGSKKINTRTYVTVGATELQSHQPQIRDPSC